MCILPKQTNTEEFDNLISGQFMHNNSADLTTRSLVPLEFESLFTNLEKIYKSSNESDFLKYLSFKTRYVCHLTSSPIFGVSAERFWGSITLNQPSIASFQSGSIEKLNKAKAQRNFSLFYPLKVKYLYDDLAFGIDTYTSLKREQFEFKPVNPFNPPSTPRQKRTGLEMQEAYETAKLNAKEHLILDIQALFKGIQECGEYQLRNNSAQARALADVGMSSVCIEDSKETEA